MPEWFTQLSPWVQALLAGGFTWVMTLLGATLVLFKRSLPPALDDAMLGFAGGVMIAASFWSLLAPGIEIAKSSAGPPAWLVAAGGFLLGAAVLRGLDALVPHLHPALQHSEGPRSKLKQSTLLFLAMTIHNIPEGLAVGVAFGAAAGGADFALGGNYASAIALAAGIGIQNLPEGISVAMPMRRAGLSRWKCFHVGHLSAIVEPVAALLGAWLVTQVGIILPWALCFAAGAMIFVVIEELIPESQANRRIDLSTLSCIVGFTLMMILDVALG
ncbi:ZIP family metal transporter [Haloferula sp. A504]|uniref:ZIP family metal transporter n=1 Tax=Haloferula sp. A504 TaxID=3373601 RepID=UPI0031C5ACC7|nr:ZIP family metal transporter [Verrucomicrobiaceae bacterium E54]